MEAHAASDASEGGLSKDRATYSTGVLLLLHNVTSCTRSVDAKGQSQAQLIVSSPGVVTTGSSPRSTTREAAMRALAT